MRMKNQYDFRKSPRPLSSEDIARHKDFDALLRQHGSGKRRAGIVQMRRLMYTGAALAAAAIALLLVFRTPGTTGDARQQAAAWEKQIITPPPLPQIELPYQQQTLPTAQVTSLEGNPHITIPADAFVDGAGNAVSGDVELRFRKLDDFVDFFLAGIKLTHDSANVKRQLESAGMVEIYAEQNGQRVFLAPGKIVQLSFESNIELVSNGKVPAFYEYFLDTDKNAWVNQGLSSTEVIGQGDLNPSDPMYEQKQALYDALAQMDARTDEAKQQWTNSNPAPAAPAKPQKSDPDQPTIELDFLANAVPQTADGQKAKLYQGAIWQISPRSPAYDQRAFGVTWQSAKLTQIADSEDYELVLSHGTTSLRLIVNPVLTGSAYEQALGQWRAAYAEYERALADWKKRSDEAFANIDRQAEKDRAAAIKNREASWAEAGASQPKLLMKLRHEMTIDRLGLWAVAQPLPSTPTMAAGRITDQFGNAYEQRVAYIVHPGQNTLHQVMISGKSRIPIAPGSTLWAVHPNGKIAVLRPSDLQQAASNVTSNKLVLELKEPAPVSKEELRRILQL